MTQVLLFHHAQGLTSGVSAFADDLRGAGHVVHTPDLYDGRTFDSIDDGVEYAKQIGFATIADRGRQVAETLPEAIVYGGFSLGVLPAQMLAQTRPGAKGALLLSGCFPPAEFETPWPEGVPAQIHMMQDDPWVLEGDLDAARELAATVDVAELFLYPGEGHLFADRSLPAFDEPAAALLTDRVVDFLDALD